MKKMAFLSGILVMSLVFGILMTSCATTSSINFASAEQPTGEYMHVKVLRNAFGGDSVLQRFYAAFPSERYQVVAFERVNRYHLSAAEALAGFLLGGIIGFGMTGGDSIGIGGVIAAPVLSTVGFSIGIFLSSAYIVTYIER